MKLTKIKNPKNVYKLILTFMFGDADGYKDVEVNIKTKEEFIRRYNLLDECPESPSSGGDEEEYSDWWEENFNEIYVPHDRQYDCAASYDDRKGIFYDENGDGFTITMPAHRISS